MRLNVRIVQLNLGINMTQFNTFPTLMVSAAHVKNQSVSVAVVLNLVNVSIVRIVNVQ